jgi:hypothetical protein
MNKKNSCCSQCSYSSASISTNRRVPDHKPNKGKKIPLRKRKKKKKETSFSHNTFLILHSTTNVARDNMKHVVLVFACLITLSLGWNFHGNRWEALSANQKMEKLWAAVSGNDTSGPWPTTFELAELFTESMSTSFDAVQDDMPLQVFFFLLLFFLVQNSEDD